MPAPGVRPCRLAAVLLLAPGLGAEWVEARADAAGEAGGPLRVAAAASLTDVLPRVAAARTGGARPVQFRFDASSRLARQIEAGMPADVFISADREWVEHLVGAGRIAPSAAVELLVNQLVAVVPAAVAWTPASPAQLAAPQLARLALAGESVPAGRYARAALASLGVWPAVRARAVSGDSVRSALAWVARGEVSAGVVYLTDARAEPRVRIAFTFPSSSHPAIVYPAAVLLHAAHAADAAAFIDFCRGDEARAIFAHAGFSHPGPPARGGPR